MTVGVGFGVRVGVGVGFGVGFGVIVRVGVGFGVRVGVGFAVGEGVTWETFSVKVVEFASLCESHGCSTRFSYGYIKTCHRSHTRIA